jgi:pyruvate kinase
MLACVAERYCTKFCAICPEGVGPLEPYRPSAKRVPARGFRRHHNVLVLEPFVMARRTKIVCTIGPAVDSKKAIARLIRAGMNVARLNCSHGDWPTREKWIGWIRELSPSISPVAILVDLQGPKLRIGAVRGGALELSPGQTLLVGKGRGADIPIAHAEILDELRTGSRLLLGDGNVELKVSRQSGELYEARAVTGGCVRSRQGVTLVGKSFPIFALTAQDRKDVEVACRLGADFLALSYTHNPDELAALKKEIAKHDGPARVLAKIETKAALKNLDEILRESDAAMVARGDLGLQMNPEDVPLAQKEIIRRCNTLAKPVITATQMLESMMEAPRPTRSEVADVANAILDGSDAVMLSGETATGRFPIACVETMARIAAKAEAMLDHEAILARHAIRPTKGKGITHAIARAVVRLAESIRPRAILTTTTSGQTACLVSKFRPRSPILCATWNERTHRQMALVWGVETIHVPLPKDTDEIVAHAMEGFLRLKWGITWS